MPSTMEFPIHGRSMFALTGIWRMGLVSRTRGRYPELSRRGLVIGLCEVSTRQNNYHYHMVKFRQPLTHYLKPQSCSGAYENRPFFVCVYICKIMFSLSPQICLLLSCFGGLIKWARPIKDCLPAWGYSPSAITLWMNLTASEGVECQTWKRQGREASHRQETAVLISAQRARLQLATPLRSPENRGL